MKGVIGLEQDSVGEQLRQMGPTPPDVKMTSYPIANTAKVLTAFSKLGQQLMQALLGEPLARWGVNSIPDYGGGCGMPLVHNTRANRASDVTT